MKGSEVNTSAITLIAVFLILSFACVSITGLLLYLVCSRKYRLNWFEKNLLETAESTKELQLSQESFVDIQDNAEDIKSIFADCTKDEKIQQLLQPCEDRESASSIPTSPTSCTSYQLTFPIAQKDNDNGLTSPCMTKPRIPTMQANIDHTKIDSSMYQDEMTNEEEDVRGSVRVSLSCDPIGGMLTVRLIEARDLQTRGSNGTANPYAKIRLLPNKANVWQTRIHKKTLNPVFDEDFVFEVQANTISRNVLEVLLFNFDAYSRHHSIGAAQFPLASIDLSEKADVWRTLGPLVNQDPQVDLGELMISLSFLPSAERLTVVVIKARNLRVVDDTRNSSDPYVKVCIVNGTKRIKKKKTGVHRNTVSPVINEALTFDIGKETLKKSYIEFHVLHDSLLGSSELLGVCRVGGGAECSPEEREFFHAMLHSKTAMAQWLTLAEPKVAKVTTKVTN